MSNGVYCNIMAFPLSFIRENTKKGGVRWFKPHGLHRERKYDAMVVATAARSMLLCWDLFYCARELVDIAFRNVISLQCEDASHYRNLECLGVEIEIMNSHEVAKSRREENRGGCNL